MATRRLRVGLWLFKDLVGRRRRRHLDEGLSRIAHALGTVRECDVLIESHAISTTCRTNLGRKRRVALERAQHAVSGPRGRRLRRRLQRLRSRLSDDEIFRRAVPPDLFGTAVERRLHGLSSRLKDASAGDPDALHRLRLQVKKLRYCLALIQTCSTGSRNGSITQDRLGRVQDQLGDWNDRRLCAARGGARFTAPRGELRALCGRLARIADTIGQDASARSSR